MKKFLCGVILFLIFSISYGQTQAEMNNDANTHYLKTENEINKVYKQILMKYSDDTLFIKKLKIAQRLWIKLRDAELELKFPDRSYSGSLYTMCYMNYKTDLTQARIDKLKKWIKGTTEGDACSGSTKKRD